MDQQPIEDLGVIVNDREGQEPEDLNIDEAVLPIRVPHTMFDKFLKAAQFNKYPSVEAWAAATLVNSLTTKIAAPSIDSPGYLNNQEAKKISGPSHSGIIRRG